MTIKDHYRAINLRGFCRLLDAYGIISWHSSHPVRDALSEIQLTVRGGLRRELKEIFRDVRDQKQPIKKPVPLKWMDKTIVFDMKPVEPGLVVLNIFSK